MNSLLQRLQFYSWRNMLSFFFHSFIIVIFCLFFYIFLCPWFRIFFCGFLPWSPFSMIIEVFVRMSQSISDLMPKLSFLSSTNKSLEKRVRTQTLLCDFLFQATLLLLLDPLFPWRKRSVREICFEFIVLYFMGCISLSLNLYLFFSWTCIKKGGIDEYCDDIRDTSTWGGQLEIQAVASFFEVPVHVFRIDSIRQVRNLFPLSFCISIFCILFKRNRLTISSKSSFSSLFSLFAFDSKMFPLFFLMRFVESWWWVVRTCSSGFRRRVF